MESKIAIYLLHLTTSVLIILNLIQAHLSLHISSLITNFSSIYLVAVVFVIISLLLFFCAVTYLQHASVHARAVAAGYAAGRAPGKGVKVRSVH
jgi:hypothetical protein